MTITLTFDHEHRLGVGRCSETLTVEQLSDYLDNWKHPDYVNYDELFIATGLTPSDLSFADLLSHAENAAKLNRYGAGEVRSAVVMDEEL